MEQATKSVCMFNDVLLQGLPQATEQSCKRIVVKEQALICHPSQKLFQISELPNTEHDRLSMQDMSHFAESLPKLTNDLGREGLNCSVL